MLFTWFCLLKALQQNAKLLIECIFMVLKFSLLNSEKKQLLKYSVYLQKCLKFSRVSGFYNVLIFAHRTLRDKTKTHFCIFVKVKPQYICTYFSQTVLKNHIFETISNIFQNVGSVLTSFPVRNCPNESEIFMS